MLAHAGGGRVGTQLYDPRQCCEKVLEMYPCCAGSWVALGSCNGGHVKSRDDVEAKYYNAQQCYLKALELDSLSPSNDVWKNPWLWYRVGDSRGGKILETVYTPKMCFENALEIDPKSNSLAWIALCYEGGAQVSGKQYTAADCGKQALLALPFSQTHITNKDKMVFTPYLGPNMVFKPYLHIQEVLNNFKPSATQCKGPSGPFWESHFWVCLGVNGGGEIDNKKYTSEDCCEKAIEIYPTANAWHLMACLLNVELEKNTSN